MLTLAHQALADPLPLRTVSVTVRPVGVSALTELGVLLSLPDARPTGIVCRAVGLQVDGESVPYVAGWGEGGALDAALEFAETIDALARPVENAAQAEDEVTAP